MLTHTKLPLDQRLANVTEILISFAASPIPSLFFQTLADYTRFAIHYDFLAIALVNPNETAYIIHHLDSKTDNVPGDFVFEPIETGLIGTVIADGHPHRANGQESDSAATQFEQVCAIYQLPNQMVIPLKQGDQKIGALVFAAKEIAPYDEQDEQIGILISSGLSANFEMARLYQTLSDERSTLSALLESTQDGFFVVNPEGIILIANGAFLEMFGFDKGLSGEILDEVFPSGDFRELFNDQENSLHELALDDGRVLQANRHPVMSGFGELLGWAVVLNDITLLKELVQMKTEFVNTVAHDLKNPLASIRMAADLIPVLGETNDSQKDMHGRIVRTTSYMKELVTELLDIGQLESDLGLNISTFDLAKDLGDAIFALRTDAEVNKISVETTIPNSMEIEGDAGRLRQLFLNLVGNAIKYTPENGTVWLTVSELAEDKVEVIVKDNGLGIPENDVPRIFDKFYRVATENRANIKGTGLGLAITKSIADAHGGDITVESEELKGTTFTVTLPKFQPKSKEQTG